MHSDSQDFGVPRLGPEPSQAGQVRSRLGDEQTAPGPGEVAVRVGQVSDADGRADSGNRSGSDGPAVAPAFGRPLSVQMVGISAWLTGRMSTMPPTLAGGAAGRDWLSSDDYWKLYPSNFS